MTAEQQDTAEAPASTAAEAGCGSRGASPVAALRACSPAEQQQQQPHAAADVPAAAEVAADAHASAEAAGTSPALVAAADLEERAEPQPEASSSSSQQHLSSSDVASHAIAVVNFELSLAEPSSTMVAQASQQQLEGSTPPQQPAAAAACQPDSPAVQHELAQGPAPAAPAADTAETAAQPAAEAEPAAATTEAPELPEQQQGAAESAQPAECSSDEALPLPAEEPSGFEAECGDECTPPLVPEASEEPALPVADAEGEGLRAGMCWLASSNRPPCCCCVSTG